MDTQTRTKHDLLLGGPGLRGYAYKADAYCVECAHDIINALPKSEFTDLEASDTDQVPVPSFFPESDSAQNCCECGEYLYGPRRHWIAMSGLYGCLPDFCCSCESLDAAVESLAELFELGRTRKAILKRYHTLELNNSRDGAQYCEITECDCDDPDQHNNN